MSSVHFAGTEVTGRRFMAVGHGFTIARFGFPPCGDADVAAKSVKDATQMMVDGLRKYLL